MFILGAWTFFGNSFRENLVLRRRYPRTLLLIIFTQSYLRLYKNPDNTYSTFSKLTSSSITLEDGGAPWSENDWLGGLSISEQWFSQTEKQRNEEKRKIHFELNMTATLLNDSKYFNVKFIQRFVLEILEAIRLIKADSLPPTKTSSDNMWCLVDLKDWLQKRRGLARQCAVKQDASGCRHSYIADHIFRPFSNRKFVLKSMSFKWLHRGANK